MISPRSPYAFRYQDWLEGPEYEGKCAEDIRDHTITSFDEVIQRLEAV